MTSSMSTTRYVQGTRPNRPVYCVNSMRHESSVPIMSHTSTRCVGIARVKRPPSSGRLSEALRERRIRQVISARAPSGMNRAILSTIESAYRVPRRVSPSRSWSATAFSDPKGM